MFSQNMLFPKNLLIQNERKANTNWCRLSAVLRNTKFILKLSINDQYKGLLSLQRKTSVKRLSFRSSSPSVVHANGTCISKSNSISIILTILVLVLAQLADIPCWIKLNLALSQYDFERNPIIKFVGSFHGQIVWSTNTTTKNFSFRIVFFRS